MARYEHLNIYKEAYNLNKMLFLVVSSFEKNYRTVLGYRMLDVSTEIVMLIIDINQSQKAIRGDCFDKLKKNIEKLILYIRIGNDLNLFKKESTYLSIMGNIVKLKKMIKNWIGKS